MNEQTNKALHGHGLKRIYTLYVRCIKLLFEFNLVGLITNTVLLLISGFIPPCSLWLMQVILNSAQTKSVTADLLFLFCILYIALDFLSIIISQISAVISFSFETKLNIFLSEKILNKTIFLNPSDFENPNTYNLIRRAQDKGASQIYTYILNIHSLFQITISLVGSAYIVVQSTSNTSRLLIVLTLLAFSTVISSIYSTLLSKKQYTIIRKRTSESRRRWYYQYLLSSDTAFKEIKLFSLTDYLLKCYLKISQKQFCEDAHIVQESSIKSALFSLFDSLVIGTTLIVSVLDALEGKMLIGNVATFIKGTTNVKNGIQSICTKISGLYSGSYYVSDFFEFLDYKSEILPKTPLISLKEVESIQFNDVSFRYSPNSQDIFSHISLTLKKKNSYAILGKNGSGKSTLLKLLMGFYTDYQGEIKINGSNLLSIDKDVYHNMLSVLLQDFTKYELSVRENVAVSNICQKDCDEKILQIMKSLGLDYPPFTNIDNQLGYMYGDGIQISGGEWLKIALCRALFHDKREVLVLDEPTATLDHMSAENVLNIFKNSDYSIKILVVHHWSQVVNNVDNIIFLDDQNVFLGPHQRLYQDSLAYRTYYDKLRSENV